MGKQKAEARQEEGTKREESRRGRDLLLSFLVPFQSTVQCLCSCCLFAPSFIKCTSLHSRTSLFCPSSVLCLVTQLCPTLCDPMDCSLPGSCVHGILQARILEWVAMPSSRGSSLPKDRTPGSNSTLSHLLHWQAGSLPLAPPGRPQWHITQP